MNSYIIKSERERLVIDHEDVVEAARCLNGAAYKMYIYLYLFCGYELEFSTKKYIQYCGGGDASARRALQELIKAGYLIKKDGYYLFVQSK